MEKIGKFGASGLLIMLACGMTVLKIGEIDNDAWLILNCGRYVIETGTIPHIEFATIHENLNYVMQQWLTAVIFRKIFSNFGADALIFFAWLTGFILMFVYYRLCLFVSGGNKKISVILALMVSILVTNDFIVTRPQIFSTLILLFEIFLLEKYFRERKIWILYALPIFSVLLINLHAAIWLMTIILLLPYAVENFVKNWKKKTAPIKPLILTAAGIIFAGFINPYGVDAMIYVLTSGSSEINYINEMSPPAADDFLGVSFFIFCGVMIITFSKKVLPLRYFLLTFGLMFLALNTTRGILLFLTLGTFPLAYAAKDWNPFDNIFNIRHKLFLPLFLICILELCRVYILAENSIWEMHLPMKIIFTLTIIFLACFIFFYRREGKLFSEEIFILRRKPLIALTVFQVMIFLSAVAFSTPTIKYEPYKAALDFLLSKNRAEDIKLLTGFHSGGYAEFRGVKTYIDPRADVFISANNHKKDILKEYLNFSIGNLDFEEFFERYKFTHILITTDESILYFKLSHDKNFRLLFEYESPYGQGHIRIFEPVKK